VGVGRCPPKRHAVLHSSETVAKINVVLTRGVLVAERRSGKYFCAGTALR